MILSSNSIGIDEVGRGPLAGPVGVGGVFCLLPPSSRSGGLKKSFFAQYPWASEVTDSKKLSAGQREYLAHEIINCPQIISATALVSASVIDQYGIVYAIRKATVEVIEKMMGSEQRITNSEKGKMNSEESKMKSGQWEMDPPLPLPLREGPIVQLDGKTDYGLRAVLPYPLETIIKGDQKIWQIAAASIIAKVARDQYMIDLSHKKKYAVYGFERHKGYGTLMHRQAIYQYGLSSEHRKSFCKKFIKL